MSVGQIYCFIGLGVLCGGIVLTITYILSVSMRILQDKVRLNHFKIHSINTSRCGGVGIFLALIVIVMAGLELPGEAVSKDTAKLQNLDSKQSLGKNLDTSLTLRVTSDTQGVESVDLQNLDSVDSTISPPKPPRKGGGEAELLRKGGGDDVATATSNKGSEDRFISNDVSYTHTDSVRGVVVSPLAGLHLYISCFIVLLSGVFKDSNRSGSILSIALIQAIGFVHFEVSFMFFESYNILCFLVAFIALFVATNSMNVIDGVNGNAIFYTILLNLSVLYVSYILGVNFISFVACILLGVCSVFVFFNFSFKGSARMFLGDSGAFLLGFLLCGLLVLGVTYFRFHILYAMSLFIYPLCEIFMSIWVRFRAARGDFGGMDSKGLQNLDSVDSTISPPQPPRKGGGEDNGVVRKGRGETELLRKGESESDAVTHKGGNDVASATSKGDKTHESQERQNLDSIDSIDSIDSKKDASQTLGMTKETHEISETHDMQEKQNLDSIESKRQDSKELQNLDSVDSIESTENKKRCFANAWHDEKKSVMMTETQGIIDTHETQKTNKTQKTQDMQEKQNLDSIESKRQDSKGLQNLDSVDSMDSKKDASLTLSMTKETHNKNKTDETQKTHDIRKNDEKKSMTMTETHETQGIQNLDSKDSKKDASHSLSMTKETHETNDTQGIQNLDSVDSTISPPQPPRKGGGNTDKVRKGGNVNKKNKSLTHYISKIRFYLHTLFLHLFEPNNYHLHYFLYAKFGNMASPIIALINAPFILISSVFYNEDSILLLNCAVFCVIYGILFRILRTKSMYLYNKA